MDLTMRYNIHQTGYTPSQPLLKSESVELAKLERNIRPLKARLYVLCVPSNSEILCHLSISCDACGREIIHTRTLCATCINADLSDNVDLCLNCIHQTPSRGKFNHKISHILVQTDRVIHDYSLAWIIREANATVGRVKSNLRGLQEPHQYDAVADAHGTSHTTSEMLCSCCGKAVTTPFWVCVECALDVYVCHDCNSKREPPLPDSGHEISHILAQVYDNKEIIEVDAINLRFQSMERRITELESNVQWRLESLESNINTRLSAFEEVLHKLSAQITTLTTRSRLRP
ncbi:hypothetical protein BD779DRAFT_913261 [Infundibulicybe gibba]|nr:hypothetical protein BD779DRAFT_913261 [Infundibulicybe gibba]